ncbi:type II toxin-antitoxin system VapC family toxin [Skermania sp. ID1734]|uniref:type II toxin-antitoxin system VapC family toxin n=1 Tax=Skermania sp. ID1734 TaxID=2597516 RepID=UPI00117C7AC8|nr:type II toxin-antitoxin system VapC family toxin [Skermania sp. ID1734]TSD94470.1 type II toxin-antitoxin system VapC family toxin [Skermania sp. ID1734]
MIVFADSSALVKLYSDESGADAVRTWDQVIVSQLARVEVPAALWRKHRSGGLAAHEAQLLSAEFEADYFGDGEQTARFAVIAVTGQILDDAARLVAVHGLRAYDGVQLASALAAAGALPEPCEFGAFDRGLCDAAAAEGLLLASRSGSSSVAQR